MTRKDKERITTDGGPTLFDGLDTQEPTQGGEVVTVPTAQDTDEYYKATAEEWAETMRLVEATKQEYDRAGVWAVWPPETLLRRGELYYNQRVKTICNTMTAAGAPPDVINVVCNDYIGILSGTCKFAATVEQIQTALHTLNPSAAFSIDRYGLYFGLFLNYSRFLLVFKDYDFTVKGLHATEDTKRVYLSEFYPPMDARAVRWLLNKGYFQPSDFSGFTPAEMGQYFARINAYADLGEYVLFYTVARLALLATPDELAEVTPPPNAQQAQTDITVFCEAVVRDTVAQLDKAAEKFEAAVSSDTPTEQAQARQAGKDWHDDTNARPVKIHQNFGLILSKPVHVAPNGADALSSLPIQPYIDEFNEHPIRFGNIETYGTVTEQSVQRVFEGLNLLPQYLSSQARRPVGGRYVFHTNLNEFAEICGYVDAGLSDQRALLGALLILRNLYFVVDKPLKRVEFVDRKGRTRRRTEGGPTAIQFVNVPEIGLKTGELVIELFPDCLKGTPTYIYASTFKQLRARNKSTPQSRFNYQIATKSHKSENDLIDDVFGLRDKLEQAKTQAEQKRVKTYIQNHRAEYRTKLLGWFAEYVEAGILTDYTREPSKTDKRDFVLSWRCPDTSKLTPPPSNGTDTQEPDEQGEQ